MKKSDELKNLKTIQEAIQKENRKLTDEEINAITDEINYSFEKAKLLQNCVFSKKSLLNETEEKAFIKNAVKTQKAMDMYYCNFNRYTGDIAWWCYEGMINSIIKNEPVWLIDI